MKITHIAALQEIDFIFQVLDRPITPMNNYTDGGGGGRRPGERKKGCSIL